MTAADDVVFLLDPHEFCVYAPASSTIERIGDLLGYAVPALSGPARAADGKQETT